jgi:maltose/moltooligosaccharide transporter
MDNSMMTGSELKESETSTSGVVKNRLPNLTKVQMFMMTFGYFGTQVAFSMQTGKHGSYLSNDWCRSK